MTSLRQAAQQALEALLLTYSATSNHCDAQWQAITALKAALAEPPEQNDLTAMLAIWGVRCEEFDAGCAACRAWRLFDTYKSLPNSDDVFALISP